MSRVQPQTLTDEELLQHIYMANYNVSVDFVKELYQRFSNTIDERDERDLHID